MILRIISALVLAPVVLAAIFYGGIFFHILIGAMGLILVSEWFNMVGRRPAWLSLGVVYVVLSVWALWQLRIDPQWGAMTVFWLVGVVWGADTGGYLFGMNLGGPKLAPAISPKKTWSGFLGGTLLGASAGWGSLRITDQKPPSNSRPSAPQWRLSVKSAIFLKVGLSAAMALKTVVQSFPATVACLIAWTGWWRLPSPWP